jgi:hypothetical protein
MTLPVQFTGLLGSYQSVLANIVLAFSVNSPSKAHSRTVAGRHMMSQWAMAEQERARRKQWAIGRELERAQRRASIVNQFRVEEERYKKKSKEIAAYSVLLAEI